MKNLISFEDFKLSYDNKKNFIYYHEFISDIDNPLSIFMKLNNLDNEKNKFILESINSGEFRSRYSVIGGYPDIVFKVKDKSIKIENTITGVHQNCNDKNPFDLLEQLIQESKIDIPEFLPSMSSGLFGFIGYEMIQWIEDIQNINNDDLDIEDSIFIRPRIVIIYDNLKNSFFLICNIYYDQQKTIEELLESSNELINHIISGLNQDLSSNLVNINSDLKKNDFSYKMEKDYYKQIFDKAKDYIKNGDIFQVVLSQRFFIDFNLDPIDFYRALRHINPSPYMFYYNFSDFYLIGASPEVLVKISDGNKVQIRPIAGTRKRGANKKEDKELEKDLLSDEKELAEHLMLLDLGRNDISKICNIGTLNSDNNFIIEYYSHVMHIVSDLIAEKKDDINAIDVFKACFPVGTVSGAPKVRAIEIINELEQVQRKFYSGGVGYFSANGDMDMCIAIRTALIKDNILYTQSGGGIVMDSKCKNEYQECINKANSIFASLKLVSAYNKNNN